MKAEKIEDFLICPTSKTCSSKINPLSDDKTSIVHQKVIIHFASLSDHTLKEAVNKSKADYLYPVATTIGSKVVRYMDVSTLRETN